MVDKQVYRNLEIVTSESLDVVKRNFAWVTEQLSTMMPLNDHLVVIMMGSTADKNHCDQIGSYFKHLGVEYEMRVVSAYKSTEDTLTILREYESRLSNLIFVDVAN